MISWNLKSKLAKEPIKKSTIVFEEKQLNID